MAISSDRVFGVCRIALSAGLCGVLLACCDEKKQDQTRAPTGQVIAHVGTEDITREELENEFRWADIPGEKRDDDATVKRVLEELVVRKYLVQLALADQLDHKPTVRLDVMRSRELTLSNAFVQRNALAKITEIRDADILRYIDSHPLKFSKRESLTVDQISFPLNAHSQPVIDATKDLITIEEIDQKLTELSVLHSRSTKEFNSGDVSVEFIDAVRTTNATGVFFVRVGPNGVYFKVESEKTNPLEGEAAVAVARQLVRAEVFRKVIDEATNAANAQTKFEGKYATTMFSQQPYSQHVEPEH